VKESSAAKDSFFDGESIFSPIAAKRLIKYFSSNKTGAAPEMFRD